MSHKLALTWHSTHRHPIARIDVGQLRQLLQALAEHGDFPIPAIHCDERVQARDVSIVRHSLAHLTRVIQADEVAISVIEEAQFTRSKLRILVCPFTNSPLLAVSPALDIDMPNNYLEHIARDIELIADHGDWDCGHVPLTDLIESMARRTNGLVFQALRRAADAADAIAPYLTTPRTVLLQWQTSEHKAAPTAPVASPPTIIANDFVLDPSTGRLFAKIMQRGAMLDACIAGPAERPEEWDRILITARDGSTASIASFEYGPPAKIVFDFEEWKAVDVIEYHHGENVQQPTLRLRETIYA